LFFNFLIQTTKLLTPPPKDVLCEQPLLNKDFLGNSPIFMSF
jgi:hypothetical protein